MAPVGRLEHGMASTVPSIRTVVLLWFSVLILLMAPIVAAPYLPMLDAPSHQARLAVLRNLLVTGTGSDFYRLDTLFLPNMAFDFTGLLLTFWVDPAMVGRLFFAAMLLLTVGGVVVLNRVATGRWSPLPLAAALLSYNLLTILGFFSFGMGVALVFWALAARLSLMGRPFAIRLVVGSLFGIVLLICHVSAFGIYAVILAGIGIEMLLPPAMGISLAIGHVQRTLPRAAMMALELVPACVLFTLMSTGGEGKAHYDMPYWHNKIFNAIKTVTSGSLAGDLAFLVGTTAFGLLLVGCGRTRLNRPLLPGLMLLCAVYLLMPAHLSGGSYVDSRLPVVIALLAVAACRFDPHRSGLGRAWPGRILIAVVCAALVLKQGALTVLWYEEGKILTRVADTLNSLPPGAVILQVECQPEATDIRAVYQSRQPPLTHGAALGAANGTRFAAISWTIKGQQPIETVMAYQPYKLFQNGLSPETCSPAQVQAAADTALRVRNEKTMTSGVTDPLFLLLLRPRVSGMLAGSEALIAQTVEFELYHLD